MTFGRQAHISLWIIAISTTVLLSYLLLLGCTSHYLILDSFFKAFERFLVEIGIVLFLCLLGGILGGLDAYGSWLKHRNCRHHYLYEMIVGLLLLALFIALLYPFITRDMVIKGTNARVFSEFKELGTLARSHFEKTGGNYDGFCESQSFLNAQSALASINTHEGAFCTSVRRVTCRTDGTEFTLSISNSLAGSNPIYLCLDADHTNPVGSELSIEGTRCE